MMKLRNDDKQLNGRDKILCMCDAGKIISEMILLLADSSALSFNVHNYVKEIRKGFDYLVTDYSADIQASNLSFGKYTLMSY